MVVDKDVGGLGEWTLGEVRSLTIIAKRVSVLFYMSNVSDPPPFPSKSGARLSRQSTWVCTHHCCRTMRYSLFTPPQPSGEQQRRKLGGGSDFEGMEAQAAI